MRSSISNREKQGLRHPVTIPRAGATESIIRPTVIMTYTDKWVDRLVEEVADAQLRGFQNIYALPLFIFLFCDAEPSEQPQSILLRAHDEPPRRLNRGAEPFPVHLY